MFSGDLDREEYEDELYREEDDSELSEPDSDVEFHLYSQLHYSAGPDGLEEQPDQGTIESDQPHAQQPQTGQKAQSTQPQPSSLSEVIVIDSGPDVITLSDNTEEEDDDDGVCATKGQRSRPCSLAHKTSSTPLQPSCPVGAEDGQSDSSDDTLIVLDSESELDSESDSDHLENWMILGKDKQKGDRSIQLNLSVQADRSTPVNEDDGESWAVCDKDREAQIFNKGGGPRRLSYRYYTEKSVTCHNCKKTGHLSKNCPSPKKLRSCLLCGTVGHIQKTCPNRHCSNCFLPGHTYDDCLERAYWHKRCHRCCMTGHFFDDCPEIWRQYHLTTKLGPPRKAPKTDVKKASAYCYNCSQKGHFGFECSQRRMFNGTYPTCPYICHYDTALDIRHRENRTRKRVKELQEAALLELPAGGTGDSEPARKKHKPSHIHSAVTGAKITPAHTPKRRIAHTPRNHHTTHTPNSTHKQPQSNTHIPHTQAQQNPDKPHSACTPLNQKKKKKRQKKKKTNKQQTNVGLGVDEAEDFPRGPKKFPPPNGTPARPLKAKHSPDVLFRNEGMSKKKKRNRARGRDRKAANTSNMYPTDENLFLIKQKKKKKEK
ncbi:zinc finger CCHC domain-containing protein 7, partial [Chanos chanos]|uniref:Zinc finger CCHC domain-containing protein 7 n=1 Tax=Chanos chanos TaxID=29144 RepID=A0A6J2WIS2_CHACN